MPHLFRAAAAVLLLGFTRGQDISINATSLSQVANDDFLDATCLANANPGIDTLSIGDTFNVPLVCCGTEVFTCGGDFCTLLAECVNLQTGAGTISLTTVASTVTASVTGTMASGSGSDSTITSTASASDTPTDSGAGSDSTIAGTTTDSGSGSDPTITPTASDSGTATDNLPSTTSTSSDSGAGGAAGGGSGGSGGAGGGGGGGDDPTTPAATTANTATAETNTDTNQASGTTATTDTSTTNQPSSTTASSTTSSSTSSGMPTPTAYLISTKQNTTRADFDEFIKTLPDQGQGNVIAYDNIPWQSYVTKNLTAEQADTIRMNSIVELIGLITEEDGEAGIAAARGKPCSPKSRLSKRETSPRTGSDYHLGMLSAPRALMDVEDWPDYEFDSQLGKGQTIYIMDSGYRSSHEEFAATGRTVDEYVVPNALTLSISPFVASDDILAPEDMTDYNGHGTAVASVAGGITQGVASGANLVIVKFRNAATQPLVGKLQLRGVNAAALRDAWDHSINDIIDRRNGGDTGKFVINMSYGFKRGTLLPELTELVMNQEIPFAQAQDITVVVAAGNDAPTGLDRVTPQNLGTTDNGLITVGGVEKNGALFTDTSPDLGRGGSISIYAAARDVLVAGIGSDSELKTLPGTSMAAPAVAGMAAYFFSLPELDTNWPAGRVARAMKQFFALSARVQRNSNPVPDNLGYTPPSAGSIVVAWNRHPDNALAGCGVPASKVKRQDDLPDLSCPSSPSESDTSMTTMTTDSTTSLEASSTTSETSSTTSPPSTTTGSFCTIMYGDGSSCVEVPDNTCAPGSMIVCPLAKRGAHAATATTFFASGSFATVHPTAVAMAV